MVTLTGSICLSDIPKEFITTAENGKKYLRIEIHEKKEADQWNNTHYIQVDTYKDGKRADQKYYLGNLKTRSWGNANITNDERASYNVQEDEELGF
jgi:hypothetical protein